MELMFVVRCEYWQGCFLFTQSLSFFSYFSYFSLNSNGVIFKCADMRRISLLVNVGVMVLQQFAHESQSFSCHTSAFNFSASLSKPAGFNFSTLLKYLRKSFL